MQLAQTEQFLSTQSSDPGSTSESGSTWPSMNL